MIELISLTTKNDIAIKKSLYKPCASSYQIIIAIIIIAATKRRYADDQVPDCRRCRHARNGRRHLSPVHAAPARAKNIVLVHGGFVDGSGWQGVYNILKKDGYNVTIVQNPTTTLADDVAVTRRAIAQQDGPVVLVGHSYGGVVVSEAGTDDKVKAVVYIAAFAPDKGESVASLIANPPAGAPVPPILPPVNGFLFLDKAKFAASSAADVDAKTAAFMADSQVPWGVEALGGAVTNPAWKSKPSLLPGRHE